jgi:hypothetical protein
VKLREDMVLHKKFLCKNLSGGVFASLGIVIILLSTRFITLVCNCNTLNLGYKNFFAHIHKFRCYSSLHIFSDLLLLFSIEEEWLFLIVDVIII